MKWTYAALVLLLIMSFYADAYLIADSPSPSLTNIFSSMTILGGVAGTTILVTLLLIATKKTSWVPTLFVSMLTAFLFVLIIKAAIARPRPLGNELHFLGFPDYSFPSAHAAAVFTPFTLMLTLFKKYIWVWLAFGVFIGVSRIFLGLHYVSDVVAGALIGLGIGDIFVYVQKKYKVFAWTSLK